MRLLWPNWTFDSKCCSRLLSRTDSLLRGVPWELQPGTEGRVVNRVQLDVQAASPTADSRRTVAKTSLHQAISGTGEVLVRKQMYRVPTCDIGIEVGGLQRGMPCQDCQTHLLKRELVNEILCRKKVRFAERVEEQTPEGIVAANSRNASSSSSSDCAIVAG